MTNDMFKKQMMISGIIILASIIVTGVIVYFLAVRQSAMADAITIGRQAVMGQATQFGMLADLKQNAPAAAKYQAAMNELLPSQDDLITFPPQVDDLSRTDGVTSNFAFQPSITSASADAPGSVGFNLNVSGPMSNIIAFMKDFEVTAPILLSEIDSVNVTGNGSTYTLAAQGRVFFQ